MKANELRIGNFVVDSTENVTKIMRGFDIECAEHFNGILLTQKILLICGFVKTRMGARLSFKIMRNIHWRKDGNYFHYYSAGEGAIFHLKYVHELQNLYFALTGQELEINL